MREATTYVFYGYSAEYVLHPLFAHMRDAGYDCVEIMPENGGNREAVQAFRGRDTVLVTSAHVFLDEHFPYFAQMPGALSVLEMLDILRPQKRVYYPHDLTELMHPADARFVPTLFDVLLSPLPGLAHYGAYGAQVETVGWIKKSNAIGPGRKGHVAHAFADIDYYCAMGMDAMQARFAPVWAHPMDIRCPACPQAEAFTQYMEEKGYAVLPADTPSTALIEANELLLTNGMTSMDLEAALSGRYMVNLVDESAVQAGRPVFWGEMPNVAVLPIEDAALLLRDYAAGTFVPEQAEDRLAPFAFDRAVRIITA